MAEEAGIFNSLAGAAGNLTSVFGKVVNAGTGLAGTLLTGKQNISDYTSALAGNTDLLGKNGKAVANLVNGLAQFAEGALQEYQALTGFGASFGKEMVNIKVAAAEMGMTTEEMVGFLKDNSEGLRAFGGTTDIAINRFKAFSKEVLDSQVGTELRKLGYTANDINEGLALYGEITARNARGEQLTVQQQAAGAQNLLVELDGLAKITGKNRSQLADEMKERRRQGDVAAFLSGKTAEEQQVFNTQLLEIQSKLGKNAADAFVDVALRGAPTTETTRNAMLAMGSGAEELYAAAAAFNSGQLDTFTNSLDGAIGSAMAFQQTEEFKNAAILGGMNSTTAAFADASSAAYNYNNTLDAAADGTNMDPIEAQRQLDLQIRQEQLVQMKTQTGVLDETIRMQEGIRKVTVATMKEAMPRLENAALHAIDRIVAATPSAEDIARQAGGAIDKLFNAAEGLARGNENFQQSFLDSILNNLFPSQQATETATEETARELGMQTDVIKEGNAATLEAQDQIKTRVDDTKTALENAEASLAELTAQGFTQQEGAIKQTQEQISNLKRELLQAQAELHSATKIAMFNASNEPGGRRFSGGFAAGGNIGAGEYGMVGELGPEFVSGPANVMSAKTSMGVMQNLMKGIRGLDKSVQESSSSSDNQISNSNVFSDSVGDMNKKFDVMISQLRQLINVENTAVDVQRRTAKVTKGLQGNMLRGVN